MSSQKRFSIALIAIALTLVAAEGGSHLGAPGAGRDGQGQPLVSSGFVAVGGQPIGLEASPTARRGDSVNRLRPPGEALPFALAAAWMLLHLWGVLGLERRAPFARPSLGWMAPPRAPPLSRLL